MGRHLSNVFNTHGFERQIRLTFTSGKAYQDFATQIKNMADSEDVGAHEIEGVVSARQLVKVGDEDFFLEGSQQEITKSFIYDPSERRELSFQYKKKKRRIVFNVFHKNFGAVVETLPDFPVYIKFVLHLQDQSTQLVFSIHPERAKSVSALLDSLETGLAYIEKTFAISKNKRDVYLGIKNAISFWKRAKDVEDVFNIQFVPQERTDTDIYNLDKLYVLCKQGGSIKRIIEGFTQDLSEDEFNRLDDVEIGSIMAFTWERSLEINLWKQSICIPCRYYIFNACLESINIGNRKKYTLSFKTTENHSIEVIEMTKDAAEQDPMNLGAALQKAYTAKTYAEWTNAFYKR